MGVPEGAAFSGFGFGGSGLGMGSLFGSGAGDGGFGVAPGFTPSGFSDFGPHIGPFALSGLNNPSNQIAFQNAALQTIAAMVGEVPTGGFFNGDLASQAALSGQLGDNGFQTFPGGQTGGNLQLNPFIPGASGGSGVFVNRPPSAGTDASGNPIDLTSILGQVPGFAASGRSNPFGGLFGGQATNANNLFGIPGTPSNSDVFGGTLGGIFDGIGGILKDIFSGGGGDDEGNFGILGDLLGGIFGSVFGQPSANGQGRTGGIFGGGGGGDQSGLLTLLALSGLLGSQRGGDPAAPRPLNPAQGVLNLLQDPATTQRFRDSILGSAFNSQGLFPGEQTALNYLSGDNTQNDLLNAANRFEGLLNVTGDQALTGFRQSAQPAFDEAVRTLRQNIIPQLAEISGQQTGVSSSGFLESSNRAASDLLGQAALSQIGLDESAANRRASALPFLGQLIGTRAGLGTAFSNDLLALGGSLRNVLNTQQARPLNVFSQLAQLGQGSPFFVPGFNPQGGTSSQLLGGLAAGLPGLLGAINQPTGIQNLGLAQLLGGLR